MRQILDYLVYLLVRVLICIVQALDLGLCARGARALAVFVDRWLPIRASVIDDNLQHAFSTMSVAERRRIRQGMWEHLFLLIVEVAHAPRKIHHSNWRSYFRLVNPELLVRPLLSDRPVILLCGHYGNFELCNYMMGVLGFQTHAIARPLDNIYLNHLLNVFRSASGQHIIPKDGCAPQLDALMAAGGALGFLVDTHAGPKGAWVNFFGRPASTHKAIAVFAKGYEAPMVVCFGRRRGRIMQHDIGGVDSVDTRSLPASQTGLPELTQWFTDRLEATIRVDPTQYWWIHRRWKDTREKKKRPAQAAA